MVGDTKIFGIQGLDFSPTGTLYGWSVQSGVGLVTIDPITGLGNDVNPAVGAMFEIQSLAFDSGGTLFGARDGLFQIDTTTGVAVQIGSGGLGDIRGLALIPEASSTTILMVGSLVLGLFGGANRKKRVDAGCRRP